MLARELAECELVLDPAKSRLIEEVALDVDPGLLARFVRRSPIEEATCAEDVVIVDPIRGGQNPAEPRRQHALIAMEGDGVLALVLQLPLERIRDGPPAGVVDDAKLVPEGADRVS